MATRWRYALSSVMGTAHSETETPCQDASSCLTVELADGSEVLLAVVSDGAGSALHGEVGAHLVCSLFVDSVITHLRVGGGIHDLSREWAHAWLQDCQRQLVEFAELDSLTSRDLACTVSAAVVGPDTAMFLQVGDGVIIVSPTAEPDSYSWVFWPQHGEYANETVFVIQEQALTTFEHDLVQGRIDEVSLLTDGLERLALHLETQTAYEPFFRSIFRSVRDSPSGYSIVVSDDLETFLSSSRIDERTNDDRTILLASRRNPSSMQ